MRARAYIVRSSNARIWAMRAWAFLTRTSRKFTTISVCSPRLRRCGCCGDWSRVCGPTPTVIHHGVTGVFLDPPYDQSERDPDLYAVETPVAADVRKWCLANGDDKRLRIALCGYAGEGHEELEASGWGIVEWKAGGGYGSQSDGSQTAGRANAKRERIWFSPHCVASRQPGLFDASSM